MSVRRAYLAALVLVLVAAAAVVWIPHERQRGNRAARAAVMAVERPTDARNVSCGAAEGIADDLCYVVPSTDVVAAANHIRDALDRATEADVTPVTCRDHTIRPAKLVTKRCTAETTIRGRVVLISAHTEWRVDRSVERNVTVTGTQIWVGVVDHEPRRLVTELPGDRQPDD